VINYYEFAAIPAGFESLAVSGLTF